MAPKADWTLLEREYVTGNISFRDLGAKYGVAWSTVHSHSKTNNWADKRMAYRDSVSRQSYDRIANKYANEQAEIHSESILVARATLRAYADQLSKGMIKVMPKDAMNAVSTLLLLMGEPTARSEAKVIEFSTGGMDADFLRRLVETARERIVEGTVVDALPAGASDTRSD